jgi:hypothetical protein
LAETCFRDPCDFQAVRQAIAQSMAYAQDPPRGPFGRLGWSPELKQWVQEEIATHGLHLNGRFRQLNASPSFSLIRFETNGPAVWFKAVGAPNQREYPVTLALARLFSQFLPQIVATRPEWNGWLALEAQGRSFTNPCLPPGKRWPQTLGNCRSIRSAEACRFSIPARGTCVAKRSRNLWSPFFEPWAN